MQIINLIRVVLAFLLPGGSEKPWSAIAKEAAELLLRLLVFVLLYALLCHAIRSGVADWLKAAVAAALIYAKTT